MPHSCPTLMTDEIDAVVRAAFEPGDGSFVGVEVEWPVHRIDDCSGRTDAEQIHRLSNTGLPAGSRVTFEPGGQVELSTAPRRSASAALEDLRRDECALRETLRGEGLATSTVAVDQRRPPARVLELPRYRSMEAYFDQRGPAGRWMMCNTASTQVNISHDAFDPRRTWYVMNMIAPVLVAMFAHSPGRDAHGVQWTSLRQGVWGAIDPCRTAPVRTDQPPEQAWRDYALSARVLHVLGDDTTADVRQPVAFGEWMRTGLPCGWPTVDDFRYHLTTLFPPVRPRGWLELRVLDLLPDELRQTAVLTVATACNPDAGAELRRRLPFLGHLFPTAARVGRQHPALAASARTVASVVREHVEAVSQEPDHADLLGALCESMARRASASPLPTREFAPDLRVRDAPDLTA